ncbi:MAG: YdcH family protein [Pseudomonadota bacterium]
MSLSSRITELRRKHESLSREIEVKQRQPASDALQIKAMKRRKLELKDEIARLSGPH